MPNNNNWHAMHTFTEQNVNADLVFSGSSKQLVRHKKCFVCKPKDQYIYTLPIRSPVHGENGALLHVEKCNRDIIFPHVRQA